MYAGRVWPVPCSGEGICKHRRASYNRSLPRCGLHPSALPLCSRSGEEIDVSRTEDGNGKARLSVKVSSGNGKSW